MLNFEETLSLLSERRPIFHSEADFQHAFAWLIHKKYPEAKIRLERPCIGRNGRIYLDIWIKKENKRIGIELKYKTKKLHSSVNGEKFELRHQSAQDIARYDLLSDLERIEGLLEAGHLDYGYALFLTNDPGYWRDTGRRNRVDEEFRIREGRTIDGHLSWADHAADGTKKNREEVISLSGTYTTAWSQYSKINTNLFRYLLIKATRGNDN